MYKHLLVPLDGSRLSEAAIPVSIFLAEKLKAKITLLHIVESSAPKTVHGEHHLKTYEEATEYLEKIIKAKYPKNMKIKIHVHSALKINVVNAIASHHNELLSDLLVMTTHGWGGIKEVFFGNNAQQILNTRIMSVLFIPPDFSKNLKKVNITKILSPIDDTELHEQGLETAVELASKCNAELFLVNVIPTMSSLPAKHTSVGMLLPNVTRKILELHENNIRELVLSKMDEISEKGIKVRAEISRGYPGKVINKIAKKEKINLIVIGTHGKAGLNAFWSGSIAAKIVKKSKIAMLFVPAMK